MRSMSIPLDIWKREPDHIRLLCGFFRAVSLGSFEIE
jgi:hypothetical protein